MKLAHLDPVRRPWLPPLVLAATVVLLGLFPVLRTPDFYFWDDSAAVFLPTWRTAGLQLWSGSWPAFRPDFWMGGNWAVEAQFGMWSPLNLLLMMLIAPIPDMVAGAIVVKLAFQLLLAGGTYALAREYGAKPWLAYAVAAALPFAGFTLYYDASTWIAGLMAFAWTPWFWWATRRCARGALNPLLMFAIGYLLMTNGNPYGALAALIVLAGVGLETLLVQDRRGLKRIVVAGALVGATAAVAYLPLVLSSSVGWRTSRGISNDGFLVPDLTMLAATSNPSYKPFIRLWVGSGSTVPVVYSAWFLLPLLPWLPWRWLAGQGRRLAALAVVGGVYLALAIGPSALWLFRWPVRLMQYAWLPLFVLLAVLLSQGVAVNAWRARAAITALVVAAGAWLAFSASPRLYVRHSVGFLLALVLTAAMVFVLLRFRDVLPAVMVTGTAIVLAAQLGWSPSNRDVAVWGFPSDEPSRVAYAQRYQGPMVQIANPDILPIETRSQTGVWLLFGSMPGAFGVESTTSYTGIGFRAFSEALCMNHAGATCAEALDKSTAPAGDLVEVDHLLDALKARTVVVQRSLVPGIDEYQMPPGWSKTESNEWVVVFSRDAEVPYPGSRLAAVSGGVSVAEASATNMTERATVSTGTTAGALQFARLAWPGYTATLDGQPVEVHTNTQGLIELGLPPGLNGAHVELTYQVPGYSVAVPLLVVAVLGAIAFGVLWERSRRSGVIAATQR